MKSIRVLHIGIKNWPLESESENESLRGGGSIKYCDLLLNGYSNHISSYVITRRLKNQSTSEFVNGIKIFRVTTLGGRKFRLIILNIKSFFVAIKIIRKENINILHGHILTGIFTAFILGKFFKIPVVGTPYSIVTYEFSNALVKFTRFFEKRIYRSIDRLVFESYENKQKAQYYTNEMYKNSVVIHTGIDIPKISRKRNRIDEDKSRRIKILYVGRLVNIKCLDKLILSLNYIEHDINNKIEIDMVGEGEMHSELSELIKTENFTDKVTLHGYVMDIIPFYEEADIFVLPSEMEGLSISLLEAMSFGLACIVNNFGVPFEKPTVYIMSDNEPETIANAIEYFLKNSSYIEQYGNKARETIKNNFSIKAFSDMYVEVYTDLLNTKGQ